MPTYACTGSNGFIASHLITKMLEQASVRAIVRREMDAPELNCLRELQACWLCGIHL
jgi:nucleoside-diphosphate-sugar epimerase